MLGKLKKLYYRFDEIVSLLSQQEVFQDSKKFQELSKEQAALAPFVKIYTELSAIEKNIKENQEICAIEEEKEIQDLAKEEIKELKEKKVRLEKQAELLFLPKDPQDNKNIILEIRAGTGGEEAALFVGDLYRMYKKYAESKNWKVETMEFHPTEMGGLREIILAISGNQVYSYLKFEIGTHRVQRIPVTETQGRIHTSAVTVAVLPEADEVEISIQPSDLRIDTYRSQGAGGQHVNTTDSAVRITHIPTGVVVSCQEERSQIKNRSKAMKWLRAKLYEQKTFKQESEEAAARKEMVGTGDRSGRIRTYNFPQGRVTDHRINLTLYQLENIMQNGDIETMVQSLIADQKQKLLEKNRSQ